MASYLNTLNQIIYTNPSIVTSSDSDDAIRYNSLRVRQDINNVTDYINQVIVQSYKSLASKPLYPFDAVESGLSGLTIITYPENEGNDRFNTEMFWKQGVNEESGRPCTVKESFDYILGQLVERVVEIRETVPDITDLEESLACVINNQMRLKKDAFGEKYILNCLDQKNNQFSLAKHIYEFVTQLANGDDYPEVFGELDSGEANYPNLGIEYSRINNRVESIFDLIDVDLNPDKEQTHPSENQILQWTWGGEDGDPENDGGDGYFAVVDMPEIPSSLNDLSDVNVETSSEGDVLVRQADGTWGAGSGLVDEKEEYLGSGLTSATIKDINNVIKSFATEIGLTGSYNNLSELMYGIVEEGIELGEELQRTLYKKFFDSYSSGSQLTFDGKEKWYSNLSGNISNLNKFDTVPEIFTKGANYLNSLSSDQLEQLVAGGFRLLPFVFVNSFNVNLKNKLDQNFWRAQFNPNLAEVPATTNTQLNLLRESFTEERIKNIFNSEGNRKFKKLENEISSFEKINPLGTTRTSTVFVNEQGSEELYYKPNLLLGVSRTDLQENALADSGVPIYFQSDENGNIDFSNNSYFDFNMLESVYNFGSINSLSLGKVQHSGYSRIMILGPYKIGDEIYLCPEPILNAAGINYPFGICISETFLTAPIKELLSLSNGNFEFTYPVLYETANKTLFELIKDGDETYNANSFLTEKLYNKIISCPVGFITRNDSPRKEIGEIESINVENNTAHSICKAMLGINHDGTENNGYDRISNYLESLSVSEFGSWITNNLFSEPYNDVGATFITEAFCLNLPYCKIQTQGLSFDSEILDKDIPEPPTVEIPDLTLEPNGNLIYGTTTIGNVYPIVFIDRILYESKTVFYSEKYLLNANDPPYVFKTNFLEEDGLKNAYLSEGATNFKIFAGSLYLDFFEVNTDWNLIIRLRDWKKGNQVLGTDLVSPIIIGVGEANVGTNSFPLVTLENSEIFDDDTDIALTFESETGTIALTEIVTDLKLFMRIKFSN